MNNFEAYKERFAKWNGKCESCPCVDKCGGDDCGLFLVQWGYSEYVPEIKKMTAKEFATTFNVFLLRDNTHVMLAMKERPILGKDLPEDNTNVAMFISDIKNYEVGYELGEVISPEEQE